MFSSLTNVCTIFVFCDRRKFHKSDQKHSFQNLANTVYRRAKKIVQFSSTGKLLYYIRCVHSVKNHQNSKYRTTRFQLILPVQSQNVTKNRTEHRMHVEGIQICQINRWNNSFQNMYGMNRQHLTVWPEKSILCKKTPQSGYFWLHEYELPDFGRTWTPNR